MAPSWLRCCKTAFPLSSCLYAVLWPRDSIMQFEIWICGDDDDDLMCAVMICLYTRHFLWNWWLVLRLVYWLMGGWAVESFLGVVSSWWSWQAVKLAQYNKCHINIWRKKKECLRIDAPGFLEMGLLTGVIYSRLFFFFNFVRYWLFTLFTRRCPSYSKYLWGWTYKLLLPCSESCIW